MTTYADRTNRKNKELTTVAQTLKAPFTKLVQPAGYDRDEDLINPLGSPRFQPVTHYVQPVAGYEGYTHLVKLEEGCQIPFALAKLTSEEVESLPRFDYGEWVDEQFGF